MARRSHRNRTRGRRITAPAKRPGGGIGHGFYNGDLNSVCGETEVERAMIDSKVTMNTEWYRFMKIRNDNKETTSETSVRNEDGDTKKKTKNEE